jgi:N-methylhydantoinase B/oxoprolinase/acetone carboxylase alpha subunit
MKFYNNLCLYDNYTRNSSFTENINVRQVAANHRGVLLIQELMREYGVEVVQAYMTHIQTTAEMSVRQLMKQVNYHPYALFNRKISISALPQFLRI